MIAVQQTIDFSRGRSGRRRMVTRGSKPVEAAAGRVPRVAKLMALAIRFEGLVRDGEVSDQSELARLAHVTQPRKNGSLAPVLRGEGWGEGQSGESEVVLPSLLPQSGIVQIMNLLHLPPDIQESLLFLPRVTSGKAPIHEKLLRPIAAEIDWGKQREMSARLKRA